MSDHWLSQLPDQWRILPLRRATELKNIRVTGNSRDENYIGLENIEPWTGKLLKSSESMVYLESTEEEEKTGVVGGFDSGDVLFGKLRPYLAKAYLAQDNGICTTELLVLKPTQIDGRFLIYVLLTNEFINQVNTETFGARMPRADWSTIGDLSIPIPPIAKQWVIADYLDRETTRIDTLIAAKQSLLDLLDEKRRALVTHVVTHGLNATIPTRDSGVEWLGPIPTHWKVISLKRVSQIGNGSTPLRDNEAYWKEGSYPWLTSTVVNNDIVGEPTEFVTPLALEECHLPIVKPNSVLVAITGQGKTRGMAALLPYEATINQHMAYISPQQDRLGPKFLQLYLTGVYDILRIISEGMGSTKGALTIQQIAEFPIPLPPIVEQREIVSTVSKAIIKIGALTQATQKTIDLLRERRTALIAAAVTGQLHLSQA